MPAMAVEAVDKAYRLARERRRPWEPLWRECFAYAAPVRGGGLDGAFAPASRLSDQLFDGTAPDAVEQLAASLLAELAPPNARWFEIVPGVELSQPQRSELAPELERITRLLESQFARSNFAVELHQAFLDLVTVGTATLLFQEAPPEADSAFRFVAVPAAEMAILGDGDGRITHQFRTTHPTLAALAARFAGICWPEPLQERLKERPELRVEYVEAAFCEGAGWRYVAFLPAGSHGPALLLQEAHLDRSPFLTFRWIKAAGELYGRSPVMTALPDIKTANKVVELILKNASIAVTGIWLAEDDGVLNPANIDLTPGSIIPKAPGSAGLVPLQAPGRFDVSELVLSDLRARIRHTLLVDKLGPLQGPRMTATEVLERSAEAARLLGAIYGRLQGELLAPLVQRAAAILRRRGEIPDLPIDGRVADIAWRMPLARLQAREEVRNLLLWLDSLNGLGPAALAQLADVGALVRRLADALGVPAELVREPSGPGAGPAEQAGESAHVA